MGSVKKQCGSCQHRGSKEHETGHGGGQYVCHRIGMSVALYGGSKCEHWEPMRAEPPDSERPSGAMDVILKNGEGHLEAILRAWEKHEAWPRGWLHNARSCFAAARAELTQREGERVIEAIEGFNVVTKRSSDTSETPPDSEWCGASYTSFASGRYAIHRLADKPEAEAEKVRVVHREVAVGVTYPGGYLMCDCGNCGALLEAHLPGMKSGGWRTCDNCGCELDWGDPRPLEAHDE